MPYIAFELDALNEAPAVARAAGISDDAVIAGLARMWAWCFRHEADAVDGTRLMGLFGCADDTRIGKALVAFGFLDAAERGWRVRGADRYLKIKQAQSDGGKKTRRNLRQYKKATGSPPGPSPEITGSPPAPPPAPLRVDPDVPPGLTPNTEHRTPNTEEDLSRERDPDAPLLSLQDAERTDGAMEVVRYYCQAMAANGIETRVTDKKKDLVRKRLGEGIPIAKLKQAIDGLTWSDWHMGRDPKTKGAMYTGLEYAIGSIEQVEAMAERVPKDQRGAG